MNEFENLKSEKNNEKSIESFNIFKEILSFLPQKQKLNIIFIVKIYKNY